MTITIADLFRETLSTIGEGAADAMMEQASEELSGRAEAVKASIDERIETITNKVVQSIVELSKDNEQALLNGQGLSARQLKKKISELEDVAQKEITALRKDVNWKTMGRALRDSCIEVLDVGIDAVMGEVFCNWEELQELADPEQTPPDQVNEFSITKYGVQAAYRPNVEVSLYGINVMDVDFKVSIKFLIDGGTLVIQGGKIQTLRLSRLRFSGVMLMKDQTILEQALTSVEVPGAIHLKTPIAINFKDAMSAA